MPHVLDASALLALMQAEPGSEVVEALLDEGDCVISAVNLAEVAAKLVDHGLAPARLGEVLQQSNVAPVDFDAEQAATSAALRPLTREAGLSLGDRACLALARGLQAKAVTADRAWADVAAAVRVEVVLIR